MKPTRVLSWGALGMVLVALVGCQLPTATTSSHPPPATATPALTTVPPGTITRFALPAGGDPHSITSGPDGNLWFTEYNGNRIGRMTTQGALTLFALPANCAPESITTGPDGNLWFTAQSGNIGKITPAGKVTLYPLAESTLGPEQIIAGPDSALWFIEDSGYIGRITMAGG
ncbi:MAG: virginiamycin B lyase, partial [Ktedonobacterales bacterium]|nr:virginiamycin B lyase [Ktedonobacterales bacterium]